MEKGKRIKEKGKKGGAEMKKLIILGLVSFFVVTLALGANETKTPITVAPKVLSVVGNSKVTFEPTRWPDFYKSSSDNPVCAEKLRDEISLTQKSGYNGNQYATILAKVINFSNEGLDQYRKSAKLLISWTVRVEGVSKIVNPWTAGLCHPWHGTSYQKFPGGNVMSRLYINGSPDKPSDREPFANIAIMTLPAGTPGVNSNPSDPTHTGSAVVNPKDFGGEFPNKLNIEIKWYNDTCMKAITPKDMRNLVITVTPI